MSGVTNEKFAEILTTLLSPNNELRNKAEESYYALLQNSIGDVVQLHLEIFTFDDESISTLSMVLLRKLFLSNSIPHSVGNEKNNDNLNNNSNSNYQTNGLQELLKNQNDVYELELYLSNLILDQKKSQTSKYLLRRICDVLISLMVISDQLDMDFLKSFIQSLVEEENSSLEICLYFAKELFFYLSDRLIGFDLDLFNQMFVHTLNDKQPARIQICSLQTLSYFLILLKNEKQMDQLFQLISNILKLIKDLIEKENYEETIICIQELNEIVLDSPIFFKKHSVMIIEYFLQIISQKQENRLLINHCSQLLINFVQNFPNLLNEIEGLLEQLIDISFQFFLNSNLNVDSDYWKNGEELEYTSEIDIGEEMFKRLSQFVNGEEFLLIIFEIIPNLFLSKDPQKIFSALRCISSISEGCKELIENEIKDILEMILQMFNTNELRIKYECCRTIGFLSLDFAELINEYYSEEVFELIINVAEENDPFIKIQGLETLTNFIEYADPELIVPYLDKLIKMLFGFLVIENVTLQENVITALAGISMCVNNEISKFYDQLVPHLKDFLSNISDVKYDNFISKVIECISIIGMSVGKELFEKDGKELMGLIIKNIEEKEINFSLNQKKYLFQGFLRISQVLEESFIVYLPKIIDVVIQSINNPFDLIGIEDEDEEKELLNLDSDNWEFIDIDDKRIIINNLSIEEKVNALELIIEFTRIFPNFIYNNFKVFFEIILPLCDCKYDNNIKKTSIIAIESIFSSIINFYELQCNNDNDNNNFLKEKMIKEANEIFKEIINYLIDITKHKKYLNNVEMVGIISQCIQSINNCITVGKHYIQSENVKYYFESIPNYIENSILRKKILEKDIEKGLIDISINENEINEKIDKENMILSEISNAYEPLLKYHKKLFLPYFHSQLFDYYYTLLQLEGNDNNSSSIGNNTNEFLQSLSVCAFDDIIEHCGQDPEIFNFYWEKYNKYLLNFAKHKNPELRQPSCYALGVCAKVNNKCFQRSSKNCCQILIESIEMFDNQDPENEDFILANENCISSIGKILFYNYYNNNQNDVNEFNDFVQIWLNYLPIWNDQVEMIQIAKILLHYINNQETVIIGENGENLPKMFSCFSLILNQDFCDTEVQYSIITAIQKLITNISFENFLEICNLIKDNELKENFLQFFQN
ncbi:karyopherin (importin) beta [Anaeramoeba flamelloides]|uniref:Karyopherin (Importin) beta n=1 Tax=Anaeramoeba flamelloides TaxID=1746091 RepID=A0AAV8A3Q4_9EUKA|nr:karyopherin (importin) beta [Anaeramoeba flamelloides]